MNSADNNRTPYFSKLVIICVSTIVIATYLFAIWGDTNDAPAHGVGHEDLTISTETVAPKQLQQPQDDTVPVDMSGSTESSGALSIIADLPTVRLDILERHAPDTRVPLDERIDELRDAALAGDPDAALELAGSLASCADAPRNEQQLDTRLNTLYQTRRVPDYVVPIDNLYEAAEDIKDNYRFCVGISLDQVLDHHIYMKLAADNGRLEAKSRLTNYAPMPRDGIFEAFSRAWRNEEHKLNDELKHGFDAALAGDAAAMLDYGILALALGHDPTEAIAFRLAGLRLKYSDGDDQAKLEQEVELLRLSTSTDDMEKAVERAVELLSDQNCCYQFK